MHLFYIKTDFYFVSYYGLDYVIRTQQQLLPLNLLKASSVSRFNKSILASIWFIGLLLVVVEVLCLVGLPPYRRIPVPDSLRSIMLVSILMRGERVEINGSIPRWTRNDERS